MGKQEVIIYSKVSPKNKKQNLAAIYRSMEKLGVSYEYHKMNDITKEVIYEMLAMSENGFTDIVSKKAIENYSRLSISQAVDRLIANKSELKQMLVMSEGKLYSKNVYESRYAIFPKKYRALIRNHYKIKSSLA